MADQIDAEILGVVDEQIAATVAIAPGKIGGKAVEEDIAAIRREARRTTRGVSRGRGRPRYVAHQPILEHESHGILPSNQSSTAESPTLPVT